MPGNEIAGAANEPSDLRQELVDFDHDQAQTQLAVTASTNVESKTKCEGKATRSSQNAHISEDEKSRNQAYRTDCAWTIANLVNLLNNFKGDDGVDGDTIEDLVPFEADNVIQFLQEVIEADLSDRGREMVREIMVHPGRFRDTFRFTTTSLQQDDSIAGSSGDTMLVHSTNGSQITHGSCEQSIAGVFEVLQRDSSTGKWLFIMRKPIQGHPEYTQEDEVPDVTQNEENNEEEEDSTKPTYIKPLYVDCKLQKTPKNDSGRWVRDPTDYWCWIRHYDKPTSAERARVGEKLRPTFVLRSFDRQTNKYNKQYFYGKDWNHFVKKIIDFDPNDPKYIEEYNRWLRQVNERNSNSYNKRATRESWKEYEIRAIREYFNQLLSQRGISYLLAPGWDQVTTAVNQARKDKDPHVAVRNRRSVEAVARRDTYPHNVVRMGVGEWLEFASRYQDLIRVLNQKDLPMIQDEYKYTKAGVLLYDDIEDKMSGGNSKKRSAHQAKLDEVYQDDFRTCDDDESAAKMVPRINENNEIYVSDRFGGELCWKMFDKSGQSLEMYKRAILQQQKGTVKYTIERKSEESNKIDSHRDKRLREA